MKAIIYIGHGTRLKKGSVEAKAFIKRIIERIDVPIQEISFLELTEPSMEEGFERCVLMGASEITVVPLFLLAAGHIKQDIPLALAGLQTKFPEIQVTVKDPFGVQGRILDAVVDLIRDTAGAVASEDRVLLVGRGSSDPGILTDFSKIAEGIRNRLGIKMVSVCYLAAAEPRLLEGLEAITADAEGRVIVVPYLLFSGLLLAEVNLEVRRRRKQGLEILLTGVLSSHRAIENIVIEKACEEVIVS